MSCRSLVCWIYTISLFVDAFIHTETLSILRTKIFWNSCLFVLFNLLKVYSLYSKIIYDIFNFSLELMLAIYWLIIIIKCPHFSENNKGIIFSSGLSFLELSVKVSSSQNKNDHVPTLTKSQHVKLQSQLSRLRWMSWISDLILLKCPALLEKKVRVSVKMLIMITEVLFTTLYKSISISSYKGWFRLQNAFIPSQLLQLDAEYNRLAVCLHI